MYRYVELLMDEIFLNLTYVKTILQTAGYANIIEIGIFP